MIKIVDKNIRGGVYLSQVLCIKTILSFIGGFIMKKKVIALLMCGAMIAGTLAGCGNTSTETSKPAESSAPASSSPRTRIAAGTRISF